MRYCTVFLATLLLPALAIAQGRGQKPILVLDAGGHTDRVNKVLFTPGGQQVISVSGDKTIRLWDVGTGETVRVLRPPAGPGAEGMLFAAALSPDGRTLAVGGYPAGAGKEGHPIYLIDLSGGRMKGALKGHENVIHALAFSRDGKWLASGSADHTIRLWRTADGTCAHILRGHTEAVFDLAFAPDSGRLATASRDHTGRIWSVADGSSSAILQGHGKEVRCVAWSPDGRTLATGSLDESIRLWDSEGKFRKRFANLGSQITSLTFTADSQRLLFTRGLGESKVCALVEMNTGKERVRFDRHTNTVRSGALSPDGRLAATSGGDAHETYLWRTSDGSVVQRLAGKGRRVFSAAWSANGRAIAWGNTPCGESVKPDTIPLERTFDLAELEMSGKPDGTFRRGRLKLGSLSLSGATPGTVRVKQAERTTAEWRAPHAGERPLCFAFLSEEWAVAGTDFGLYLFETGSGKQVRSWQGHTGPVWAVAQAPDGRYLLSASGDQTLRLWQPDQDGPLLSLFVAGEDWIAWTPQGYYAASPGGERLMGWQINNGPAAMASFYPAARFRKALYRPDVVRRLLATGSLGAALRAADEARGKASERTEIIRVLPPRVAITSPKRPELRVREARLEVTAAARSVGNHPVEALRLLLNGRPYRGRDCLRLVPTPKLGGVRASWAVELVPGVNRFSVQASSAASQNLSEEVVVHYRPPGAPLLPGRLHVLAVGINVYPGKNRLECAVADARGIAELLGRQHGRGLYGDVQVRLLTDHRARQKDIREGLRWLKQRQGPRDLAVVFFAGHGIKDPRDTFYLLPADMRPRELARTGISEEELKGALAELPGRVLLLLDACHAGKIGEFEVIGARRGSPRSAADDLVRDLAADECGVVVMAAARGREESEESKELGHGYFTKALLEGMSGKADYNKDGVVTLTELDNYVAERVRELSGGGQTACTAKSTRTGSFPVVRP